MCEHDKPPIPPLCLSVATGQRKETVIYNKELIMSAVKGIKGRPFRWIYYDVWGNKKDGYEVNAKYTSNDVVMIPDDLNDKQLTTHLKKQGLFKGSVRSNLVEYDGDEFTIYITYKGKPEGELRAE